MTIMRDKPATKDEACRVLTRMVGKVASKWTRNHKQDYNDIMQEGYIGVCHAYDRFDSKHGAAFSSYAYLWVRHYIRQYCLKSWHVKNNTGSLDYSDYNLGDYDIREDILNVISSNKEINKLPKQDKDLIQLRMEGFTYQEISEKLGYKNLHVCRNRYKELEQNLELF